jgi:hypothetical protein
VNNFLEKHEDFPSFHCHAALDIAAVKVNPQAEYFRNEKKDKRGAKIIRAAKTIRVAVVLLSPGFAPILTTLRLIFASKTSNFLCFDNHATLDQ